MKAAMMVDSSARRKGMKDLTSALDWASRMVASSADSMAVMMVELTAALLVEGMGD